MFELQHGPKREEIHQQEELEFNERLRVVTAPHPVAVQQQRLLAQRDALQRRRKERLHAEWQQTVYLPIVGSIRQELSNVSARDLSKFKAKEYERFLQMRNMQDDTNFGPQVQGGTFAARSFQGRGDGPGQGTTKRRRSVDWRPPSRITLDTPREGISPTSAASAIDHFPSRRGSNASILKMDTRTQRVAQLEAAKAASAAYDPNAVNRRSIRVRVKDDDPVKTVLTRPLREQRARQAYAERVAGEGGWGAGTQRGSEPGRRAASASVASSRRRLHSRRSSGSKPGDSRLPPPPVGPVQLPPAQQRQTLSPERWAGHMVKATRAGYLQTTIGRAKFDHHLDSKRVDGAFDHYDFPQSAAAAAEDLPRGKRGGGAIVQLAEGQAPGAGAPSGSWARTSGIPAFMDGAALDGNRDRRGGRAGMRTTGRLAAEPYREGRHALRYIVERKTNPIALAADD